MAGFSTNESFTVQLVRIGAGILTAFLIFSAVVGLWAGQGEAAPKAPVGWGAGALFRLGLAAGLLAVLAVRLVQRCQPHDTPWHAGFEGANATPSLFGALGFTVALIAATVGCLCVYRFIRNVTRTRRSRLIILGLTGLLCGIAANHPTWLVLVLSGLAYAVMFPLFDELAQRTHWAVLVPVFFAQALTKLAWEFAVPAQPDAFVSTLTALVVSTVAAWLLYRLVLGRAEEAAPPLLVPGAAPVPKP
jgi:hypothetical protein